MKSYSLFTVLISAIFLTGHAQTNSPQASAPYFAKRPGAFQTLKRPGATNMMTNTLGQAPWGQGFNSPASKSSGLAANSKVSASTNRPTIVSSTIAERGDHHRVVKSVTEQTNPDGKMSYRTNSYTELANGMYYLEKGEWKETLELIEPFEGGAIARYGPHKVIFAENLNTAGAIDLETPDAKRLKSHVLGLSYSDTASGKQVIVAELKDSRGEIVNSNQVIYPDGFTGVKADVRYTYTKAGLEQDVILRERPPTPESFGLDSKTTKLQVMTEFLSPPTPGKFVVPSDKAEEITDQTLDFGAMQMGAGKAFALGLDEAPADKVPVAKQWTEIDGRIILFEEVIVSRIEKQLEALPAKKRTAYFWNKEKKQAQQMASLELKLPARKSVKLSPRAMQVAKLNIPARGFVLDYVLVSSAANFTFKGDTTYLVNGQVSLTGATTFEGGAVIKYAVNGALIFGAGSGGYGSTITWKSTPYRPVFFTARDDHSVGSQIGILAPSGFYANPALDIQSLYSAGQMQNVRFAYAQQAITLGSSSYLNLSDAQFVNCNYGLGPGSYQSIYSLNVKNALFSHVQKPFNLYSLYYNGSFSAQHVTFDSCSALVNQGQTTSYSLNFVNCVLANVATTGWAGAASSHLSGNNNGFYNSSGVLFGTSQFTTALNPFQASGSGAYYLAGTAFRANGTTTVGTSFLNSLKTKTTYPPITFPRFMVLKGELTLFPQVPRYISGAPDLGYYYDVLDYSVASMFVAGGTVNVMPGTAVGLRQELALDLWWPNFFTYTGFNLFKGSTFISHGTVVRSNVFTDVRFVQEAAELLPPLANLFLIDVPTDFNPAFTENPPPTMDFRFSNFYVSGEGNLFAAGGDVTWSPAMNLELRDCKLYGGWFWFGQEGWGEQLPSSITLVNNLFDGVKLNFDPYWIDQSGSYIDLSIFAYNNLFRSGGLGLMPIPASSVNWVFKDNLFHKMEFIQDTSHAIDHNFNGYWPLLVSELQWGGTTRLGPVGANDKLLAAAPAYQTGPMGTYYLPTSSTLWNAGSRTAADAGLFHYTTRVDQTKEGSEGSGNLVNIGLHYVATANSSSTSPKDTDADGIPDFTEDVDGNGIANSLDLDTTCDLDGDGLDIAAELALGLSPSVSDNPIQITGFPSSLIGSGMVQVTVTVGSGFTPISIALYANGEIAPGISSATPPGSQIATFIVDTTRYENGLVSFSPVVILKKIGQSIYNRPVAGLPRLLMVQNQITFSPIFDGEDFAGGWRDSFGSSSMSLQAYSSISLSFDYELSVRNLADDEIKHFGPTASGFDQNHGVSYFAEEWDLLDSNGQYQSDDEFDVQVTTYFPSKAAYLNGDAGSSTWGQRERMRRAASLHNWPSYAGWIISGLDFTKADIHPKDNRDLLLANINTFAQSRYNYAIISSSPIIPIPAGYNEPEAKAYWLNYGQDTAQSQRDADWQNLRSFLGDGRYRNFYINTHGNADTFGGDYDMPSPQVGADVVDGAHSYVTSSEIMGLIGTDPNDPIANRRPYRFVFLDGCNTARGDFPRAFGIKPRRQTSIGYYLDSQGNWLQRPCAFVGWNIEVPVAQLDSNTSAPQYVLRGYVEFRSEFFKQLMLGRSLKDARILAAAHSNVPQFYEYNYGGWVIFGIDFPGTVKQFDKGFKLFGYSGLTIESYNDRDDAW